MKTVKYELLDGTTKEIKYDETAPCVSCGFPVTHASMGGTALCCWCDCGDERPEIKKAREEANNGVR